MLYNPKYENRLALIIGINKYKNANPLDCACNDAEGIAQKLKDKFNFHEDNITLLLDADASKEKIIRSFHKFTQDGTGPDDKILIFFAGHGHTITGKRGEVGFLVPVDGNPSETSTLIRWDELTRNAELIKAKHILFIMDACYGGLAITRAPSPGSRRFLKDMCQRFARQVLTAGKADEPVSDVGGPIPGHSVFTGHLLQGLDGGASTDSDIITANGLMGYVYEKVGNDQHSHQTPHYGFIEGDGDFIFTEQKLIEMDSDSETDKDLLIEIPAINIDSSVKKTDLEKTIKTYIVDSSKRILLSDIVYEEVRKYLSLTAKEKLPLALPNRRDDFVKQYFTDRITKYDKLTKNLITICIVMAHWGNEESDHILVNAINRLADNNGFEGGSTKLLNLRWYPIWALVYAIGISAIYADRYQTLKRILTQRVSCNLQNNDEKELALVLGFEITECIDLFKLFPGYEKKYVPHCEYLYKLLQPNIDEILFLGRSYEENVDRFEMLYALKFADMSNSSWGPIGRFGYKHRSRFNKTSILGDLITEAESQKVEWLPVKHGLFESYSRFVEIAQNLQKGTLDKLSWF